MKSHVTAIVLLFSVSTTSYAQQWLKEDATATIKFGPFLDSTDGATAEDNLEIKKADVRLSKNGGDMAAASADQGSGDAGAPPDELGYYDVSLNATDTSTPGRLRVMVSESGALPVWQDFMVVPASVYDSLVGGSALMANVTQISGDATAAGNAERFFDGTGYGPLFAKDTVLAIDSQTQLTVSGNGGGGDMAGAYNGCTAVFKSSSSTARSVRTIASSADGSGNVILTLDSAPAFTVAIGDTVEILAPSFAAADRTAATAAATNLATKSSQSSVDGVQADVDDLLEYFDGAPTFANAMDGHGYTSARAQKIDRLAPTLLVSTMIDAEPISQTEFEIAAGPADDDALNGALVIVTRGTHKAVGIVDDYDESSKTLFIESDPGRFEMDNGDQVDIIAIRPVP